MISIHQAHSFASVEHDLYCPSSPQSLHFRRLYTAFRILTRLYARNCCSAISTTPSSYLPSKLFPTLNMKLAMKTEDEPDAKSVPSEAGVISEVKLDDFQVEQQEHDLSPGVLQARAITSVWPRSHVWTMIFLYAELD